MKKTTYLLVLSFTLLVFIASSCSKEESEEVDLKAQFISSFVSQVNADSLQSTVEWLENMDTRFMLADNRREVAVSLKEKFISIGYPDAVLDSFYVTRTYLDNEYETWQYNVIAGINGGQYADSTIIFGAHYDNILTAGTGNPWEFCPGANDNASGVAATIEMARLIIKESYNSDYSVKFILFGAEELGLYGSRRYTELARIRSEKIKLMINYDMIGIAYYEDRVNWELNIIHYQNSMTEGQRAMTICDTYTDLTSVNNNRYANYSDSYPFSLSGYKALFYTQNAADNNYHTVNDLATHMNFEYCKEVVKASCALFLDISYDD